MWKRRRIPPRLRSRIKWFVISMVLFTQLTVGWLFATDSYKLYFSRLHYDIRKLFWGSTCIDDRGEPVRLRDTSTSRLWVDNGAGRLGNSLFNFVNGYALSKSNNRSLIFTPRLAYYIQEVFDTPAKGLYGICPVAEGIKTKKVRYAVYQPEMRQLPHREHVHMRVYLQSFKYFEPYAEEVRKLLVFHDILVSSAHQFLRDVTQKKENAESPLYIGVHVRRGDMLQKEHLVKKGYQTAPISYLESAVQYLTNRFRPRGVHLVVCSDDVTWCKQQHVFRHRNSTYDVSFSSGYSEGFDMALLSQCNHTIMTVGTFGWWASWLAGGETVYYNQPTKPGSQIDKDFKHQDFFPPQWIGLEGGEQSP